MPQTVLFIVYSNKYICADRIDGARRYAEKAGWSIQVIERNGGDKPVCPPHAARGDRGGANGTRRKASLKSSPGYIRDIGALRLDVDFGSSQSLQGRPRRTFHARMARRPYLTPFRIIGVLLCV